VVVRDYVDPMVRSGRGGNSGAIAALGSMLDCAGGTWLLAAVERGRPRLIDPERLGVVALLGRRREWRGAADERSPFVAVVCDRAPLRVGDEQFLLTRSPSGGLDLVRARAGEPIERWFVGEHPTRIELLAGATTLGLCARDRIALLDVAELVPGGCPLTDPRDVEVRLRWRSLPPSVVAVCDLLEAPARVRAIEHEGDRWMVSEFELASEQAQRRVSWPIERPERWLAHGGSLWLASGAVWTRIEADQGPSEHSSPLGPAMNAAALEIDDDAHPWLWLWRSELGELQRIDALALANGVVERWAIGRELQVRQLLVGAPTVDPNPATIIHADELAELLALEPALGQAWASWFDR
jgi:hypothetical protein